MSKTKQRRQSLYAMGKKDALAGRHFRWKRHPNIDDYRQGFMDAKSPKPKYSGWLMWFLRMMSR